VEVGLQSVQTSATVSAGSEIEDCDFVAFRNVLNGVDRKLLKILIPSVLGVRITGVIDTGRV
jgi:hypothetical protein